MEIEEKKEIRQSMRAHRIILKDNVDEKNNLICETVIKTLSWVLNLENWKTGRYIRNNDTIVKKKDNTRSNTEALDDVHHVTSIRIPHCLQ